MRTCFVTDCYFVNLRSVPNANSSSSILATLPFGHECTSMDESDQWWHLKTEVDNVPIEGYINSDYLTHTVFDIGKESGIVPVHLTENLNYVNPDSTSRAHPIGDQNKVIRDMTSQQSKIDSIHQIISYLDVESSMRYQRTGYTYCNIYAYDFCYLCNVYLPRVWWSPLSLIELSNGHSVPIQYDNTVFEIRANEIFHWLKDFGPTFGWQRVFSPQDLQDAADRGKIGVIVANTKNHSKSGHISVVVPQTDENQPVKIEGKVTTPVMSDAGWNNHNYYSYRWWTREKYSFFGFWIHE